MMVNLYQFIRDAQEITEEIDRLNMENFNLKIKIGEQQLEIKSLRHNNKELLRQLKEK